MKRIKNNELIIDNFAGGGGASHGIERALGRPVDVAINHDAKAIAMHEMNHPYTRHYRSSVYEIDPLVVTRDRPVGLAWFSPDCTHFSKAKGGKPANKAIRSLAWIVLRWAAKVRPRVIILENVEEFATWGPLTRRRGRAKHPQPCRFRKYRTFRRWCQQLEGLGYELDYRELKACDYGAPTIRKRLFVVARCDGQPIRWPEPTHAAPDDPRVLAGKLLPWRTAAEIIDWTLPCPSIFLTKKGARTYFKATGVRVNRPLAPATMNRIANGVKRYVLEAADPFIVQYHGRDEFRGQGVAEPLRTQTTENRFGVVVPYTVPRYGERDGQEPRCGSVEQPLPTITPTANGASLVAPHIVGVGGRMGQSPPTTGNAPVNTITAKGDKAVVMPLIARLSQTGGNGKYSNSVEEPLTTIVSKNEHLLVSSQIMQVNHSGERRNQPLSEPVPTITAARQSHSLVSAFIAKHFGGMVGVPADTPLPTTTARGTQNQLAAVFLDKAYSSNVAAGGGGARVPVGTVTATGTHIGQVRAFLAKYYSEGDGKTGASLADPLGTVTSKARFGLVTVAGEEYVIVDIGMRMLTPRELFAAQGFDPEYIIDRGPKGKALSKTAQVCMVGNSVSPCVAEALVRANFARPAKPWRPAKQLEFPGV